VGHPSEELKAVKRERGGWRRQAADLECRIDEKPVFGVFNPSL
jgi:hypothetical protein